MKNVWTGFIKFKVTIWENVTRYGEFTLIYYHKILLKVISYYNFILKLKSIIKLHIVFTVCIIFLTLVKSCNYKYKLKYSESTYILF